LWAINVQRCVLGMDSKLVARQIGKECIAMEPSLEKYLSLVRRMEFFSRRLTIEYINKNKNTEADELAKATTRNTTLPADVFL
jgi:UDP-N-acetylmuramoylalanine-D-glutamate ligase